MSTDALSLMRCALAARRTSVPDYTTIFFDAAARQITHVRVRVWCRRARAAEVRCMQVLNHVR